MAELFKNNFFRMLPYFMPLLVAYFSGRYLPCFRRYEDSNTYSNESTNTAWRLIVKRSLFIAFLGWLLLGSLHAWWLALLVFVSFMVADWLLAKNQNDTCGYFVLDLFVHILLLAGFSITAVLNEDLHFIIFWYAIFGKTYFVLMIGLVGFFVTVPIGGEILGFILEHLQPELQSDNDTASASLSERGLKFGGKYIGELERALIFILVLVGQPAGIGFLIAAKSIFRFGELKENSQRKEAEYIIIGTFLSFFYGILTAYFVHYLLGFF